jgi:hypothetical protein
MTNELQTEVLSTLALLEVQSVTCGKVRIGGPHDGGYVMADKFDRNTIGYSIGVGPQVQWDFDMAGRGMVIHQYDHTVEDLPQTHANFRFTRLGIGPDLSDPKLITLQEMLNRSGHAETSNMLLKIDIEGAEWDVLDALDYDILAKFDQIVIELHGFEFSKDEDFRDRARRVFSKLNHNHCPIHAHANNYAAVYMIHGVAVPDEIELTYCLRSWFDVLPSHELFPTPLDQPCNPEERTSIWDHFVFDEWNHDNANVH